MTAALVVILLYMLMKPDNHNENLNLGDFTLYEQEMEIIQGAVSAVVYQNYDNGNAVLRLSVGGGQTVTVVGTIPLPAVGERL